MKKEVYTREEVKEIIYKAIEENSADKNRYIEMNGKSAYKHTDTMHSFSGATCALIGLLSKF